MKIEKRQRLSSLLPASSLGGLHYKRMSNSRSPLPAVSSSGTAPLSQQQRPRRRLFHIPFLSMRFRCTKTRLRDAVMDGIGCFVEGLVYAIGPLLILLALGIIGILTYTFATIILPMLYDKYSQQRTFDATTQQYSGPYILPLHQVIHLALHCAFVAFVVLNILYNYFYCVMTKHKGDRYDAVVREQAAATDFIYPETPSQVQQYRQEFQDRMSLRIRRRRERAQESAVAAANQTTAQYASESLATAPSPATATTANGNGMIQRRAGQVLNGDAASDAALQPRAAAPPPAPLLRQWMLLAPFEWSYCSHSNQPKPPRSHYDHVTKSLVLNLDHYCPWMFNSIGYFNYRYFVNFLIYIFVGMFYGALLTAQPFLWLGTQEYRHQWKQQKNGFVLEHRLKPMIPFREERMLISLSFMLCMAVGMAVFLLMGFHIYLTCTAQTTIEFHGNWTARSRAKAAGQKWKNPYSQGSWYKNWQQVYGHDRSILRALMPSRREPDNLPAPIPGKERRIGVDKMETDKKGDEADFV